MPKFTLEWKLDVEGLALVRPTESIRYYVKLKCGNCGEFINDNWVYISPLETSKISGSRGTANLVSKCKGCRRENSVAIVDGGKDYKCDKQGTWQPLVSFDCRGWEPTEWDPRSGFVAETEGGVKFDDVNLSEDWVEYDESQSAPVGIYNVKHRFEKS